MHASRGYSNTRSLQLISNLDATILLPVLYYRGIGMLNSTLQNLNASSSTRCHLQIERCVLLQCHTCSWDRPCLERRAAFNAAGIFRSEELCKESWLLHSLTCTFLAISWRPWTTGCLPVSCLLYSQSAFWICRYNSFMRCVLGLKVDTACIADSHCMIAILSTDEVLCILKWSNCNYCSSKLFTGPMLIHLHSNQACSKPLLTINGSIIVW